MLPDVPVSRLPAATIPLSGTETAIVNQNGVTVGCPVNQFINQLTAVVVTGDVTGSGAPSNVVLTLPTVNSNVGTFNNVTVNAKGQVTAASNIAYLQANPGTINQVLTSTGAGQEFRSSVVLNSVTFTSLVNNSGAFYVDANGFMKDGGRSYVSTQFDMLNTTTLANITGLSSTLISGGIYSFRAVLTVTSPPSAGIKVAMAGTATATWVTYTGVNYNQSTINTRSKATSLGTVVADATATATDIIIEGTIKVNAAGTLTVQAAQNYLDSLVQSSIFIGSTLTVERIA